MIPRHLLAAPRGLLVLSFALAGCLASEAPATGADPGGAQASGSQTRRNEAQPRDHGSRVPVDLEKIEIDDGDTINIRWARGDTEIIRILGIDTPETRHLAHDIPYAQPFGEEAQAFAEKRRAMAVATEQEFKATVVENRAIVVLAEAEVPYDKLIEMDNINPEFSQTDVTIVLGANDVVNPAARDDAGSPIYGMPILDVENAGTVLFVKRSLSPGYAGVDNVLFYRDNTMMLFDDAKAMSEDIVNALGSM